MIRETVRELAYPPAILTQPTPEPPLRGDTWGDVGVYASELRGALRDCNADKASVRALEEKMEEQEEGGE